MATIKPTFIRPRVDWYDQGRIVYKAGNTYPADETLARMVALGNADAMPEKPARRRAAETAAPQDSQATADNAPVGEPADLLSPAASVDSTAA